MELIHHNKITSPNKYGGKGRVAKIVFNKVGLFAINKSGYTKLKLKAGDCVSIAQEKGEPRNCYLYKDNNGFPLRENSSGNTLLFSNKTLMVNILESVGYDSSITHSFQIGIEPTVENKVSYYGILIPEV